MSLELMENANGEIDHVISPTPSPITDGEFTITSTPNAKSKAEGTGIYAGDLFYTFKKGSAIGFVDESIATVSPQKIKPTAIKTKANGELVIRLGDSGTMSATGTLTAGGAGPISGPVEVVDAGQTKAKAQ